MEEFAQCLVANAGAGVAVGVAAVTDGGVHVLQRVCAGWWV